MFHDQAEKNRAMRMKNVKMRNRITVILERFETLLMQKVALSNKKAYMAVWMPYRLFIGLHVEDDRQPRYSNANAVIYITIISCDISNGDHLFTCDTCIIIL